jgi:hypothetical protein
MLELPPEIFQRWYGPIPAADREDVWEYRSEPIDRPGGGGPAASRRWEGFELNRSGAFVQYVWVPGNDWLPPFEPAQLEVRQGRWSAETDERLRVEFPHAQEYVLTVVSLDRHRLLTTYEALDTGIPSDPNDGREGAIDEISLTHAGEEGLGFGDGVRFRRDGTATSYQMMDETPTQYLEGRVDATDFGRLVTFVASEAFFELEERYGDVSSDRRHTVTSAVRGGIEKTVLNAEDEGPPNLHAVQEAILALKERVPWETVASPPA